jgi:hypothetical protein
MTSTGDPQKERGEQTGIIGENIPIADGLSLTKRTD